MHFVFRFGYETPQQETANAKHGWDDENSNYVVIDSRNEAEALSWCREVSERYVRDHGGNNSWMAGDFAHWIESISDCPWAAARTAIRVGEFPTADYWSSL